MMWSCMTWKGVGYACRINDILYAPLYCEILRGELMDTIKFYNLDIGDVVFHLDNDPKRTSRQAEETLEELDLTSMQWPPQSLAMNPIEYY